jgi:dienelactone hydrolase
LPQPVITTQPTNHFVNSSTTVQFSVVAGGTGPFAYQWLFDGTAIAGAANSNLHSVVNAQPTNSGFYSVIVSNASGSVTSQVSELKVFIPAPHSLSGIQTETNGAVGLTFSGETTSSFAPYYDVYPLAASSNLFNWTPLAMLQRTNMALNTLSFLDTNAPMFNQRFYRTPTNQLPTPDPQPTGPYPVGTFSMQLTNTNRSNANFMVTFWYPAMAQAGVLPAKYVDPQVAMPTGSEEYDYYDWANLGGGNFDSQAAAFFSHSLPNAPLATNLTAYPVVLYDSGGNGHRRENTDKTEDLASWGYVVLGLDTADTDVSVFPNGTVVYGQAVTGIAGHNAATAGRLLDLQFVLDDLESLNAGDPRLGGRLNLEEIGAFGWSLGGVAVAELGLLDPRCKAGCGLDGYYIDETNLLTQSLQVPWLCLESDVGTYGGLALYNVQKTNACYVQLVSTVHGSFGDYDLIVDSATMATFYGTPTSGQFLAPARVCQIVRACLLSFFNKYLKGEDDHLLEGASPPWPEAEQFLTK